MARIPSLKQKNFGQGEKIQKSMITLNPAPRQPLCMTLDTTKTKKANKSKPPRMFERPVSHRATANNQRFTFARGGSFASI